MNTHNHEPCRHCGGKMSPLKHIETGPRAGQYQSGCFKCGHLEYYMPDPLAPHQFVRVASAVAH